MKKAPCDKCKYREYCELESHFDCKKYKPYHDYLLQERRKKRKEYEQRRDARCQGDLQ